MSAVVGMNVETRSQGLLGSGPVLNTPPVATSFPLEIFAEFGSFTALTQCFAYFM